MGRKFKGSVRSGGGTKLRGDLLADEGKGKSIPANAKIQRDPERIGSVEQNLILTRQESYPAQ